MNLLKKIVDNLDLKFHIIILL